MLRDKVVNNQRSKIKKYYYEETNNINRSKFINDSIPPSGYQKDQINNLPNNKSYEDSPSGRQDIQPKKDKSPVNVSDRTPNNPGTPINDRKPIVDSPKIQDTPKSKKYVYDPPKPSAKKTNSSFTPPSIVPSQDDLVPRGGGFFTTPNTPADPRDCNRYPDSPYCGGVPFDFSPVGIDIDIVKDDCYIGLQFTPVFAFVRFPPVQINYKFGDCSNNQKLRDPEWYKDLPPEDLPNLTFNCSGEGLGILAVEVLVKDSFVNIRYEVWRPIYKWIPGEYGVSYSQYVRSDFIKDVELPDNIQKLIPKRNSLNIRWPSSISPYLVTDERLRREGVMFDFVGTHSGWQVGDRVIVPPPANSTMGDQGWKTDTDNYLLYIDVGGYRFYFGETLKLQNFANQINSSKVDENRWKHYTNLNSFTSAEMGAKYFEEYDEGAFLRNDYYLAHRQTEIRRSKAVIVGSTCHIYNSVNTPPLDKKEDKCNCMSCDDKLGKLIYETVVNNSNKLNDLQKKQKEIIDFLGIKEFPAKLPKRLIIPNGKGEQEIKTLPGIFDFLIKQIDKAIGHLPQRIKIADSNAGKEGNQTVEVEIHSLADFARETLKLLIDTEGDGDVQTNMLVRILYELGFIHQGSIQSLAMIDAMVEHLDFKHKFVTKEYPFAFNPYTKENKLARKGFKKDNTDESKNSQDVTIPDIGDTEEEIEKMLPGLLQETMMKIRTLINDEKKSLNDDVKQIMRDARIAAAGVSENATPEKLENLVDAAYQILKLEGLIQEYNVAKGLTHGNLRS